MCPSAEADGKEYLRTEVEIAKNKKDSTLSGKIQNQLVLFPKKTHPRLASLASSLSL